MGRTTLPLSRASDSSRLIHHEGELKPRWIQRGNRFTGGDNRYNDIVNPMYPEIESIIAHAESGEDPRPVILSEYSHAMGNSNGSLSEYFDAFRRYHALQGGFIWEWVDHGIRRERDDGKSYWAYGGDFGEIIHDGNFVADGLVSPDRVPHPGIWEHKKCAQPVEVVALSITDGIFEIRNRYDFISLAGLEGWWETTAEGQIVEKGDLGSLDVAPGSSLDVRIDFDKRLLTTPETYVRFRFRTREKTAWCAAGHEVAWDEFAMSRMREPSSTGVDSMPIDIDGTESGWELRCGGELVLWRGSYLNLFRAPIDNDRIRDWEGQEEKPMGLWLAAGLHELVCSDRDTVQTDRGLIEKSRWVGSDENAQVSCVQVVERATASLVRVECSIEIPESFPTLPRIGLLLETAPGFERVTWYGRGPQENHIDRKRGYAVGLYSGRVDDQHVPYLMPQENGSKCEVRWFELSNGSRIVRFSADPLFEFSVHHYTPRELYSCRHEPDIDELRREETIIAIDHVQRGVGTGSCGPDTRRPYLIEPGTYRFAYWIECKEER